jgi:hypothetical protein
LVYGCGKPQCVLMLVAYIPEVSVFWSMWYISGGMCLSGWKAHVCGGVAPGVGKCWICNCSKSAMGVGGSTLCNSVIYIYGVGSVLYVSAFRMLSSPVFKESIFLITGKILSSASEARRSGADRFYGFEAYVWISVARYCMALDYCVGGSITVNYYIYSNAWQWPAVWASNMTLTWVFVRDYR